MKLANYADHKPAQHPLRAAVLDLMLSKYRSNPRHQQRALGPSEIGEPCARKLAYKLMGEKRHNSESDPLPSIIGTAAHTWMEAACHQANEKLGRVRWLVETELEIIPGLTGHCDCYDVDTDTVIDWKFPGTSKHKEYRANGPSDLYRVQAALYGKGWANRGYSVREVAIVFLPRGGLLSSLHVWSAPFDPAIADRAIARYHSLIDLCAALDVEHYPENYRQLPTEAGHACTYCDYFRPGADTGAGCPGYLAKNKAAS